MTGKNTDLFRNLSKGLLDVGITLSSIWIHKEYFDFFSQFGAKFSVMKVEATQNRLGQLRIKSSPHRPSSPPFSRPHGLDSSS